ncbi:hypothetical protein [Alkalibacterium sp. 20]|uniref:hypothetical protein n=1 Tax=Alkalibacterium sp. 20 TaxID=1798803 RepID=UPI00090042B1|nr:hypothetical protein [Alkalibacterium sp. 20]OJF94176.1 hypothetical protein AX762_08060 [Alkalibacterium sp. 20]
MEDKSNYLLNPFQIDIDPMEKLLLINFEKDPDDTYLGFEPQVFEEGENGRGHLILGWRKDGKVDVYHQPTLKLDPKKYDIAGKGLANMIERELTGAYYEVNNEGVQAFYQFKDIFDREILIEIKEFNKSKRKPFSLLAPMGEAAENPSALPLILLYDFYFVRKKQTDIRISINGRSHKPDELPVPMDGRRMLYSRYSPKPLIVKINPEKNEEIKLLKTTHLEKKIKTNDCDIEMKWTDYLPSIKTITRRNPVYPVTLTFDPSFPNIITLEDKDVIEGEFAITAHPSSGSIGGIYKVEKKGSVTQVKLHPSNGWMPIPKKMSLKFLYSVGKIFKNWPKTYEWTGYIKENEQQLFFIESEWKRINENKFYKKD